MRPAGAKSWPPQSGRRMRRHAARKTRPRSRCDRAWSLKSFNRALHMTSSQANSPAQKSVNWKEHNLLLRRLRDCVADVPEEKHARFTEGEHPAREELKYWLSLLSPKQVTTEERSLSKELALMALKPIPSGAAQLALTSGAQSRCRRDDMLVANLRHSAKLNSSSLVS